VPDTAAGRATRDCMRVNDFPNDQRVKREAEALVEAGYDVTVVADARPHLADDEVAGGVRILRIAKSTPVPYWSIIGPLLAQRADIYHAHDIDSLFPCLAAARLGRRGARVVYDSHELWSEQPLDKLHKKRRMLLPHEGWMLRASDALISVSEPITATIVEKFRFRGPAITLLNVSPRYPLEQLEPFWRARDEDPLVRIVYAGVMQHGRGTVPLAKAMTLLPDEYTLELIGPFPQPEYEAQVREAAVGAGERVRIVGKIPPEEVIPRLASSKLSAVIVEPISGSYEMASPNKLYQSFQAGTPVIASNTMVIGRTVDETGAGVTCDATDPSDIARAIREAATRLPELRAAALAAAAKYSWDHEKAKLVELYSGLVRA
jgi:glycosyltransferase involved in cell wall biosynthesis